MIFKGICTALVTPFTKNGEVDFVALKNILDFQINAKVSAILILGTTGESPTITEAEREKIIVFTKSLLPKSIKLIVGTGSNNFEKAKSQTLQAKYLGADGVLVVTPYYNKCTQNGLYLFYKKLASETKCPIIVYNVPSRTGLNIMPNTMAKLEKLKYICGLKEANGNIDHIQEMFHMLQNCPIYCGNDNLNYLFYELGAKGSISVASNAYPTLLARQYKTKSLMLHKKLYNINKLLFIETNPIPIKYVLSQKGLIQNELRLPLTKLEEKNKILLDKEMKNLEGENWKYCLLEAKEEWVRKCQNF